MGPEELVKAAHLHWSSRMSGEVQAIRNVFLIPEAKCKNPLGKNIDDLSKHGADVLQEIIFLAATGAPGVRVASRRTKVIADNVVFPALHPGVDFANLPKLHANTVLLPAWTLFPDRRYQKKYLVAS